MTNSEIAALLDCSTRTIQRQLATLQDANMLSTEVKENYRRVIKLTEKLSTGYPQLRGVSAESEHPPRQNVVPPTTKCRTPPGSTPLIYYAYKSIHKNTDDKSKCQEKNAMLCFDKKINKNKENGEARKTAIKAMMGLGFDHEKAAEALLNKTGLEINIVLEELEKYYDILERPREYNVKSIPGLMSHKFMRNERFKIKPSNVKTNDRRVIVTEAERTIAKQHDDAMNTKRLKTASEFDAWHARLSDEEKIQYGGENRMFQRLKLHAHYCEHIK